MSAQTIYKTATAKGIAGGKYDIYPYAVETRINEEDTGAMVFGVGVVKGAAAGKNVKLPVSASTAADFEGVTVNGFTTELDENSVLKIKKNDGLGIMKKGKIWVKVATGATAAYGAKAYLVNSGAQAGYFTSVSTSNLDVGAKFITDADNGLAVIEIG